ncbi:MAG: hypothetical protein US25_C0050G0003 [Candidatus Moranbacteria bacterium GW2011_GWE1_36_7]|nr:MAG: hypothetical protein UR99_C0024G0010 [Candidatus Moranbacteria bacterium GW2011_GWD2_36_12]KKQ04680.1 MAG: hypothetical protein US16_C0051G0003 [Candidatus Moranbacteria bacterium GW2011_GWE2_36_40]KKQ12490.1 MAG: hypothetical protein US25_C0050G0003 [Candidatus Moranbacteria bacterium GW2011_GWE1_36_7]
MKYLEQLLDYFAKNATRAYLVVTNLILVIFAIWFSNVGLLPFKNLGDFVFFAALALVLGLYRPSWTFAFFIGTLALENINLAPESLGFSLRPYQFFGSITVISLLVQFFSKRLAFSLPKFRWVDAMVLVFVVGGFLSALFATNKGMSLKQAIVAVSFVVLYFLTRTYVQSFQDVKRIFPFFLSGGLVVLLYSIWQNLRFLIGAESFEVMPGRPNSTFTEADWLGMYLVFCLAVVLTILYKVRNKKQETMTKQIPNFKFQISKNDLYFVSCILYLVLTFIVLILTVSRSAWVGAVFVIIVFLKFILLENYAELGEGDRSRWKKMVNILKIQKWQWKKAGTQLLFVLIAFGVALLIAMPLTRFQIANRAVSTGGLQKITIACSGNQNIIPSPQKINNTEELEKYSCRHINLEDIENEKKLGNVIMEVYRPDPNVNIRAEIYQKSWQQIKSNPVLGIGWGNISEILGTDERGAGLNASNIFLEVWLGSGIFGILSFVVLLGYIILSAVVAFFENDKKNKNSTAILFLMAGWVAVVVPNLFNSGIFLGFIWVYFGIAVSLLAEKTND